MMRILVAGSAIKGLRGLVGRAGIQCDVRYWRSQYPPRDKLTWANVLICSFLAAQHVTREQGFDPECIIIVMSRSAYEQTTKRPLGLLGRCKIVVSPEGDEPWYHLVEAIREKL